MARTTRSTSGRRPGAGWATGSSWKTWASSGSRTSRSRCGSSGSRRAAGWLALPDDRVAQHADARHLDLDHVTVLHVLGRAVGAHPQHVARIEREVLAHATDELTHAEDRVLDGVGEHLLAVEPDRDAQIVRVQPGDDPRAHRLERIGVLAPPERAVAP